jgi:hypothetical protein
MQILKPEAVRVDVDGVNKPAVKYLRFNLIFSNQRLGKKWWTSIKQ